MSDATYSIQELGGVELAQNYPDRGLLPDSNWYNSILHTEPEVEGILSWLRSFKHCNNFSAMLSANAEGLRIVISLNEFAIFIPWTEATVTAERSRPATIVTVVTAAMPSLSLELHLGDDAADDLFRNIVPPLPRRNPPHRLFWWADYPWVIPVFLAVGVSAGLVAWFVGRSN